jgi:CHAT domain-containing protein
MIRDDLPDLLNAYRRLIQDEADWTPLIARFLRVVELLHEYAPVKSLKEQVEGLPFPSLLVALGHQLNGEVSAAVGTLREARTALVGDTELGVRPDATFTEESFARVRAHNRAATLAAFLASCGAAKDALDLFWKLEQAGRRRALWETLLVAQCLDAVGSHSDAQRLALEGIDELRNRRKKLDSGALRLNFGGRVGPALLGVAAAEDLRIGTDEGQRLAVFLLEIGRDPLLAEIVHTITRAPIPILLMLDSIYPCWSTEAAAFQWHDLLSRLLVSHGASLVTRRVEEELVAAEAAMSAAKSNLAATAPSIYSMFFRPGRMLLRSPVEGSLVADAQQVLPPDSCVIGYDIVGDDVIRWTLTHDRFSVDHLPISAAALADRVASVNASCQKGALAADPHVAPLADALLSGTRDCVEARERLLIVPSGPLRTLPFAALPWRGRPLIASHACTVLPSLGLMRDLAARKQQRNIQKPTIAAFGNPTGMQWTSPLGKVFAANGLEHAKREAREVAKLAGVKAKCGPDATKDAVLMSLRSADIVHLATHAVFCGQAPLFSAFLLAEGEQLSVIDLMAVNGRCSLIVASACSTGEGGRTSGDDVLGISRGLLGCGASAAVVALWPIDDEHTADLMIAFYQGLLGGVDPVRAMQRAQNGFLNGGRRTRTGARDRAAEWVSSSHAAGSERWWAPFVVVGM